jgi:NhaP-type Na+/H+ and K+/H+ antiporter
MVQVNKGDNDRMASVLTMSLLLLITNRHQKYLVARVGTPDILE